MATIIIEGVEQPRGSGESVFPKFIVENNRLRIVLNDSATAGNVGNQLCAQSADATGVVNGVWFI